MFAVGSVLISDDVLDASFCCSLNACLGGCCVQGDEGAPLEADEREQLEDALPKVRDALRPQALAVIRDQGVWEEVKPGRYATTCVGGAECVFVTYDRGIAKCALQAAFRAGRIDFEKPISCHLYPLRRQEVGEFDMLNYDRIQLCDPGRRHGRRTGIQLADFLKEPLVRQYGEAWYQDFRTACAERAALVG